MAEAGQYQQKLEAIDTINNSRDFKSERELHRYIEYNIDKVADLILHDTVDSYESESAIGRFKWPTKGSQRPDLRIKGVRGNYIIEVKRSSEERKIMNGISQLLGYKARAEILEDTKIDKLILIADYYSELVDTTIHHNKLPMIYISLNKHIQLVGGHHYGY